MTVVADKCLQGKMIQNLSWIHFFLIFKLLVVFALHPVTWLCLIDLCWKRAFSAYLLPIYTWLSFLHRLEVQLVWVFQAQFRTFAETERNPQEPWKLGNNQGHQPKVRIKHIFSFKFVCRTHFQLAMCLFEISNFTWSLNASKEKTIQQNCANVLYQLFLYFSYLEWQMHFWFWRKPSFLFQCPHDQGKTKHSRSHDCISADNNLQSEKNI